MNSSVELQHRAAEAGALPSIMHSIGVVIVFAILGYIFYELFLSPLRHLPGPLLARFSSLLLRWSEINARRAPMLLELHRKYGSVIRVGPNEVSIADWRVYRDIYTNRTTTKDPRFYRPFEFLGQGNVFAAVNQPMHAARRKIYSIPFSHQEIVANEAMFVDRIDAFIDRTLETARASQIGTADVFQLCGLLSLECICRLSFNYDFTKDEKTSRKLLAALEGSVLAIGILNPMFPFLRTASYRTKLPGAIGHSYRSFLSWETLTRDMLEALQNQQIDAAEKTRRFIAAPLLADVNRELGRKYTLDEATEEAMGLAVAGSGVTEHTLIYFLYALARPEGRRVQERLRQELIETGATSFAEVSTLPYLTAVLKEVYRVFPVIMSTLPRILNNPLTLKNQDITLPSGTVVGMQNYVHHRNPELFPQPDDFVPERWLEGDESEFSTDLKDMNSALTPFSIGSRNCLGQTLAKVELYLALSHIVRRLDFRLSTSMAEDDMTMMDFWAVFPKSGKLVLDVSAIEA